MKCTEIKNLLSPYLDGDLDEKKKQWIDEHLAICSSCAKELEELKEIISGLKKIPEVEPPPYFLEAVHARLERSSLLTEILRRLFVPVYIKVPIEAITVTATIIIVMVLVQKSEMTRMTQTGVPVGVQYEPYAQRTGVPEAQADKLTKSRISASQEFTFPEIHPREMGSQVVGADLQKMSQVQSGLSTSKSMQVTKPTEGAAVLGGKAEVLNAAPLLNGYKSKGVAGEYRSELAVKESVSTTYEPHYLAKTPTTLDLTLLLERQIILKTQELEQDRPKLEAILKELGITNIKVETYPDKVLFSFPILANQLENLLSKLKDWQVLSLPAQKTTGKEETILESISVKLILTKQ